MSTRFRKLPVEVEAVQWTGENAAEMRAFAPGKWETVASEDRADDPEITAQVYDKLHSTWVGMRTGHWVIKGLAGEFYPCNPDVFAATYEAAGGSDASQAEGFAPRRAPESPIEFVCSICLYDYVDWSTLSEEQLAERNLLTVINGQMTCEYHASIVGGGNHGLALMYARQQGMRS